MKGCEMTLNIFQRINAIMGEVSYIQKGEKKPGLQFRFASHDAVTGAIRHLMVKHGVVYYPHNLDVRVEGNRVELKMSVRFVNVDNPTDFMEVQSFGFGCDASDKGPGKAMSYAMKYALLKCLGLETGDDADNDNINFSPPDERPIEVVLEERFPASKKKKVWG
jgi:hypothetical protein